MPPRGEDVQQVFEGRAGGRLAVFEAVGQVGVGAAGHVGEAADVARQFPAQFVDPRHERLEVVAVLDASVLDDLLHPLPFHPDGGDAQDGVVVEGGELGTGGRDQLLEQLVDVDPRLLDNLSGHFTHRCFLLDRTHRLCGPGTNLPLCILVTTGRLVPGPAASLESAGLDALDEGFHACIERKTTHRHLPDDPVRVDEELAP